MDFDRRGLHYGHEYPVNRFDYGNKIKFISRCRCGVIFVSLMRIYRRIMIGQRGIIRNLTINVLPIRQTDLEEDWISSEVNSERISNHHNHDSNKLSQIWKRFWDLTILSIVAHNQECDSVDYGFNYLVRWSDVRNKSKIRYYLQKQSHFPLIVEQIFAFQRRPSKESRLLRCSPSRFSISSDHTHFPVSADPYKLDSLGNLVI
jgi:hypothetical protein